MAASPIYGERIRAEANNYEWYKVYSEKLSKKLGCSSDDLLPLVYLFISTILNYVIWEKKEGTADQLKFIYTSLVGKIHKNNGSNRRHKRCGQYSRQAGENGNLRPYFHRFFLHH